MALIMLWSSSVSATGLLWYESKLSYQPSGPSAPPKNHKWIYEDFDYGKNEFLLKSTTKSDLGGYVDFSSPGKDGNQMKIGITAQETAKYVDPHVQTPTLRGEDVIFISYDISVDNLSSGNYIGYIRNSANSNGITFVSIEDQKVTYLPNEEVKKSIVISDGETFRISALYIPLKNEFRVYHNGSLMCLINNAGSVLDVEYLNGYYFRFHPSAYSEANYSVNIDNVFMCRMHEFKNMYAGVCIRNTDTASYLITPCVNLTENNYEFSQINAVYSDGMLENVDVKNVSLEASSLKELIFDYGISPNTTLDSYILDSVKNITPLGKNFELSSNDTGSPYYESYLTRGSRHLHNLYLANNPGSHPRLLTDAVGLRKIKAQYSGTENLERFTTKVDSAYMNHGLMDDGTDDGYYDYKITDNRLLTVSRRVKNALIDLSLAYQLTDDEKYKFKAFEILSKVNSYPDWHPSHLLDTSELASGVSVAYDWFYNELGSELKDATENKLIECAIEIAEKGYQKGSSWVTERVNRNAVNNGGFIMAALALCDSLGLRSFELIDSALGGIEYMLPSFAPDGAWEEGPAYVDYTLEYLAKAFSSLESSLGCDAGLKKVRGIERLPYYIYYTNGAQNSYNFHDASSNGNLLPEELLYLIKLYGDKTALKIYDAEHNMQNRNITYAYLLWHDENSVTSASIPRDAYFRDVELVSMKDSSFPGETKSFLAFHGGRTVPEEYHHHCDCGHFVLDLLGERWAEDLGTEPLAYKNVGSDAEYTGTAAELYRKRAEGHNCIVINPDLSSGQISGSEAKVTEHYSDEESSFAKLDMSRVYEGIGSYFRIYELTEGRSMAVITDEISLTDESDIYWFMHTMAECLYDGNVVTMTKNGKTVYLTFESNKDAQLEIVPAEPLPESPVTSGQADNSNYKKIKIYLKASGDVKIKVTISPQKP